MAMGPIGRRNILDSGEKRDYWRKNLRLIAVLMSIWALVSLGAGILLVKPLNTFTIGQLPFGFWMAQQGAMFVFVVLVFAYARIMDKIDHDHHADD